ncbi:MAG: GFA family protein [Rhodobacteraceae bacterium]|nr:GFA family protein [Paracoccaceae bacterium]
MLTGTCHCGALHWTFDGDPGSATACNCTICRRYGTLWAYGYEGEAIDVRGPSRAYLWGTRTIAFHHCPTCGCVGWWRAAEPGGDGRRRIAVNLRLAAPESVAALPIDSFDGLRTFEDKPRDGRCVADLWA